jgi:hypothetical protein
MGGFCYQLAADVTIASDKAVFAQPDEFREQLFEIQRTEGMKAYLDKRVGPRSNKARGKKPRRK